MQLYLFYLMYEIAFLIVHFNSKAYTNTPYFFFRKFIPRKIFQRLEYSLYPL